MIHLFENSFERSYEDRLDNFFNKSYQIYPLERYLQHFGDRVFSSQNQCLLVEYKADTKAGKTLNAFIETVSISTTNKPGWAFTSQAEILIYYIPPWGIACKIYMSEIKKQLSAWQKIYREGQALNNGYWTRGILVPMSEFLKYCYDFEFIG